MTDPSLLSYFTEDNLKHILEQYRSYGPLPGILLTFLKSFVPPLPTLVLVGVNAAVYGLWLGFLYSWIGMVSGCLVTFMIVRRLSAHPFFTRWARKPKVEKGMRWVQLNAFSYVFVLSLFPVGPFVVVNVVAGLAQMRVQSYLIAILLGKGIMVFAVSFIGYDVQGYMQHPARLLYVVLFVIVSLIVSKRIEAHFSKSRSKA